MKRREGRLLSIVIGIVLMGAMWSSRNFYIVQFPTPGGEIFMPLITWFAFDRYLAFVDWVDGFAPKKKRQ